MFFPLSGDIICSSLLSFGAIDRHHKRSTYSGSTSSRRARMPCPCTCTSSSSPLLHPTFFFDCRTLILMGSSSTLPQDASSGLLTESEVTFSSHYNPVLKWVRVRAKLFAMMTHGEQTCEGGRVAVGLPSFFLNDRYHTEWPQGKGWAGFWELMSTHPFIGSSYPRDKPQITLSCKE